MTMVSSLSSVFLVTSRRTICVGALRKKLLADKWYRTITAVETPIGSMPETLFITKSLVVSRYHLTASTTSSREENFIATKTIRVFSDYIFLTAKFPVAFKTTKVFDMPVTVFCLSICLAEYELKIHKSVSTSFVSLKFLTSWTYHKQPSQYTLNLWKEKVKLSIPEEIIFKPRSNVNES